MTAAASSDRLQAAALTVAGSDSGGNAGIQADLRTFHGFGVHGCTAIAALTAQNPAGVAAIVPVDGAFLASQLDAIFACYEIRAVKTGMLAAPELIEAAADRLAARPAIPVVVDPVMVATSGARLLEPRAVETLSRRLIPRAALLTPNRPEAEALAGRSAAGLAGAAAAARVLADRYGCAVLVKGGHDPDQPAADLLCIGGAIQRIATPAVAAPLSTHGTGCTLSAAIAASLALGRELEQAVVEGKAYVYEALRTGRIVGPGATVLGMPARLPLEAVTREPL